jgi:hypothetical protein
MPTRGAPLRPRHPAQVATALPPSAAWPAWLQTLANSDYVTGAGEGGGGRSCGGAAGASAFPPLPAYLFAHTCTPCKHGPRPSPPPAARPPPPKTAEVEDWSKYSHGCAVLMPDAARAVPYWVDDELIELSTQRFAAALERSIAQEEAAAAAAVVMPAADASGGGGGERAAGAAEGGASGSGGGGGGGGARAARRSSSAGSLGDVGAAGAHQRRGASGEEGSSDGGGRGARAAGFGRSLMRWVSERVSSGGDGSGEAAAAAGGGGPPTAAAPPPASPARSTGRVSSTGSGGGGSGSGRPRRRSRTGAGAGAAAAAASPLRTASAPSAAHRSPGARAQRDAATPAAGTGARPLLPPGGSPLAPQRTCDARGSSSGGGAAPSTPAKGVTWRADVGGRDSSSDDDEGGGGGARRGGRGGYSSDDEFEFEEPAEPMSPAAKLLAGILSGQSFGTIAGAVTAAMAGGARPPALAAAAAGAPGSCGAGGALAALRQGVARRRQREAAAAADDAVLRHAGRARRAPGRGGWHPVQLLEAREFLHNEASFMEWLHMAVWMSSSAVLLLAVSALAFVSPLDAPGLHVPEATALLLLPASCALVGYAIWVYTWRGARLSSMRRRRVDDPVGANAMAAVVVAAFLGVLALHVADLALLWSRGAAGGGDDPDDPDAGGGGGGGGGPLAGAARAL